MHDSVGVGRFRTWSPMTHAGWAEAVARNLLEKPLPRRWAHTRGVAAAALTLSGIFDDHADLLVSAAWLHDVGYSPAIAATGFHPLDGARHLRDSEKADELVCRLVAHHGCALTEAAERGLADLLAREFPMPPDDLADALIYSDMTTGPDGQSMAVDARLAEILARYGPDHPVSRARSKSTPQIAAAVARVTNRLSRVHNWPVKGSSERSGRPPMLSRARGGWPCGISIQAAGRSPVRCDVPRAPNRHIWSGNRSP
jgi:HD domain